jgi:hypothetical protein
MPKKSDFTPTLLAFLQWFFRTLDPKFTESLFAGRTPKEASAQMFDSIAATVRGNRGDELTLSAAD